MLIACGLLFGGTLVRWIGCGVMCISLGVGGLGSCVSSRARFGGGGSGGGGSGWEVDACVLVGGAWVGMDGWFGAER